MSNFEALVPFLACVRLRLRLGADAHLRVFALDYVLGVIWQNYVSLHADSAVVGPNICVICYQVCVICRA